MIQQESTSEAKGVLLCPTAASKRWKYLRRICRYKQMDFQYACWQMIYLFVSPQKLYRNFQYRKQTKNQWARDDPAFLVLLSLCLCVTSVIYALLLRMTFLAFLRFTLWSVFVDCILCGIIVASITWTVANRFYLAHPGTEDKVEWAYCFDVHLNAFFPLLTILHGIGVILLVLIGETGFISTVIGNTLILVSFGYYVYITFLGFDCLPQLRKTKVLLYPFTILAVIYILALMFRCNLVGVFHLYNRVKASQH